MLILAAESYLRVRRAAGFDLRGPGRLLLDFALYASGQGNTHVRTATAISWAARSPSVRQSDRRLKIVIRFARHARAEDAAHEIPPNNVFAAPRARRLPHIFTDDEVQQILMEAGRLGPPGSLRPNTYQTLFGLLFSCGLRISEALALRIDEVTPDGLVIRKTKFRKSRLVPLHETTERQIQHYLARRQVAGPTEHLFISRHRRRLDYSTAYLTFRTILRKLGLRGAAGEPDPRLHDARHTFIVRTLEDCPPGEVARRMHVLSTYVGHARITDTYWYSQATPQLLSGIADACQTYLHGDTL